jgi:DNA-binding MarR family transcriptional regulator
VTSTSRPGASRARGARSAAGQTAAGQTADGQTAGGHPSGDRDPLPFDPVEEAARLWSRQWGEKPRMRAVTSLMRVHQLVLIELDELLRPLGLTFARYEVLVLLSFSRRGALPLGKIGQRLQVHATSVTPLVKRLEAAGLIQRTPHPEDGRAVLASITPRGREVMEQATEAILQAQFALGSMSEQDCDTLTELLTRPRAAAGDF